MHLVGDMQGMREKIKKKNASFTWEENRGLQLGTI